jgi:hypothetical protein
MGEPADGRGLVAHRAQRVVGGADAQEGAAQGGTFKAATELAVTEAIRVSGFVIIVPRWIADVFCDASATCW